MEFFSIILNVFRKFKEFFIKKDTIPEFQSQKLVFQLNGVPFYTEFYRKKELVV